MTALRTLGARSLILLFASTLVQHAWAPPYRHRTPINLDLTGMVLHPIRTIKSTEYSGALYYAIKRKITNYYRIGDVTDAGDMIYPGNPNEIERFLLLMDLPGAVRYLRIVSKIKTSKKNVRKIVEFTTNPGDYKFFRIVRTPFTLPLPIQSSTNIIKVEEDASCMTRRFSIQPEMKNKFMIGAIKYNRKVIFHHTKGLIERQVVLERDEPIITIISIYEDGDCGVEKLKLKKGRKRFVVISRNYFKVFTRPQDETIVVDRVPGIEPKNSSGKRASSPEGAQEDGDEDGHNDENEEDDEEATTSSTNIQRNLEEEHCSDESTSVVSVSSSDTEYGKFGSNMSQSAMAIDFKYSDYGGLTEEQYSVMRDIELRMDDKSVLDYFTTD